MMLGGQVLGHWPGMQPGQLIGPGDLAVTTDCCDVLGEAFAKRLNTPLLISAFMRGITWLEGSNQFILDESTNAISQQTSLHVR